MNPIETIKAIETLLVKSEMSAILNNKKLKKSELVEQVRQLFDSLVEEVKTLAANADDDVEFNSDDCLCGAVGTVSTGMMTLDSSSCDKHNREDAHKNLSSLVDTMLDELYTKDPFAKTTYPTNSWFEIARKHRA